jgi:hypothetical protein
MKSDSLTFGVLVVVLIAGVLHVQVPAEAQSNLPDLRVSAFDTSPRKPCKDETTQLIIELNNRGNAAVGDFDLTITIGNGEPILIPIPGLDAGISTTVVLDHEFSKKKDATVVIKVDPEDRIIEEDESNNTVRRELEITDC